MKIRPVRLMTADLQQEMKGNPNLKIHRVTIPYILSSYSVSPPYNFFRKRCLTVICFQKTEGQTNQSRLFYAFGSVRYVNAKPSMFDVIDCISTTEYQ